MDNERGEIIKKLVKIRRQMKEAVEEEDYERAELLNGMLKEYRSIYIMKEEVLKEQDFLGIRYSGKQLIAEKEKNIENVKKAKYIINRR